MASPSSPPPSSPPPPSSRDIIIAVIGGLLSLFTALIPPELSISARIAVGVGVLVVLALGYGIYRLMSGQRKLRDQLSESQRQLNDLQGQLEESQHQLQESQRQLEESQRTLRDQLQKPFALFEYQSLPDRGIFLKGDTIQSVVLRVASVHCLIDDIAELVPKEKQNEALCEAGKRMGETFSADLERAAAASGIPHDERDRKLKFWEDYDAVIGMGHFDFSRYNAYTGIGTIILLNSFLSRQRSKTIMDYLMAGYFAGVLNTIYDPRVCVKPCRDDVTAHTRMEFEVSPQ